MVTHSTRQIRQTSSSPRSTYTAATRTPSAQARLSGKLVAVCVALLLRTTPAVAQDLGHKLPGLLGLDAARIPEPGLYLVDRLASYQADELRDRDGHLIHTAPFNLLGVANAFGASYTTRVARSSVFFTMTVGWPIARIKTAVEDRPEAGIDRSDWPIRMSSPSGWAGATGAPMW